jgi:hypothetical protein
LAPYYPKPAQPATHLPFGAATLYLFRPFNRSTIMATIPHFGEAVHAALPYIKNGGDPLSITHHTLKKTLPQYMEVHTDDVPSFSDQQTSYIKYCWQYVAEVIALAENVWIEPRTPNGRTPDIILVHKERLYVIDIKAWIPGSLSDRGKKGDKILKQVYDSAWLIHKALGPKMPVFAYVLFFPNQAGHKFFPDPEWRLIGQINA